MTPTVAEVKDGEIVRNPFATPRAWNGTTFAASADTDVYRAFGLWPVENATADPEPWQRVDSVTYTVDTQAQTVFRHRTYADRDLATVQAERKAQLTATRDQGIFAGAVSYDLTADTDVVDSSGKILSTAPAGATIKPDLRGPQDQQNLSQLASAATDALAAGVQQTYDFKDSTDTIHRLSRDDMRGAAAAARAHGQAWWQAWWQHKDAVDATTTAQDAYEYDPADNGGWPS